MREWLLYCLLCSLIYAVAVHAEENGSRWYASEIEMTAELLKGPSEKIPVRDCAVFMPYLGRETKEIKSNLEKLGYSPQDVADITVLKTEFADSHGHSVNEYTTQFKDRIGYYGKGTLLMSVTGQEFGRSKKRIFILKLHRLGMGEEPVAESHFIGIASERQFSVRTIPRCISRTRRN